MDKSRLTPVEQRNVDVMTANGAKIDREADHLVKLLYRRSGGNALMALLVAAKAFTASERAHQKCQQELEEAQRIAENALKALADATGCNKN